ncbi:MAG TPA: phenylalanine--tRNA ligase subunit beta [Pyrinomonadaceae bacterium]
MLISHHWLRELTNTSLTPSELREKLTRVGLAIDAVETHGDDAVLDVEVPSNRPDCLSHVGIAREVTVIEDGELTLPPAVSLPTEGLASSFTSVEIKDEELCPRYAARLVRGVKIGPSPDWLVKRLETLGQRSINNVADITNYVLHEVGQPLHAFDLNKLSGKRIVVRRANAGETLKTLDGVERKLTAEMLVIADAENAVALAGIMGGEDSEISNATTDVLVESAYFNPDSVRRTARALGMDTEASRRFERGADCDGVLRAQQRCVELICELAGGVATKDAIDVYPAPVAERVVAFNPARVKGLTSLSVDVSEMKRILAKLGFELLTESDSELTYKVPSWRIDVQQEEDLVEEVARHHGYEHIASELPAANSSGEYQPTEKRLRALRSALNGLGFDEAINFSFVAPQSDFELIPAFGDGVTQPELSNPIIEDASVMRSTLLAGLLGSIRHNLNHGIRDVRLFEVGRVFGVFKSGELPEENNALAMVMTGGAVEEDRVLTDRELDFFDLKGAVDTAIDWMNFEPLVYAKASVKHLRPGQAAAINTSDGQKIGTIGRLSDTLAANYKYRQPVYLMELDLLALFVGPEKTIHYKPLPRYPSVVRDISLLLDRNVQVEELLAAVAEQKVSDCTGAKFVGVYEGANIPADKRSVTIRIEYRSDERTLRDDEVEERHSRLTNSLLERFSAEQR